MCWIFILKISKLSFTNILKCPAVFECNCRGWVSEFWRMCMSRPRAHAVLRQEQLGRGELGPCWASCSSWGWGGPENGKCLYVLQLPAVVLTLYWQGWFEPKGWGLCILSCSSGENERIFLKKTDCKPQLRKQSEITQCRHAQHFFWVLPSSPQHIPLDRPTLNHDFPGLLQAVWERSGF